MSQVPNEKNVLTKVIGDISGILDDWVALKTAVEGLEEVFSEGGGAEMTLEQVQEIIPKLESTLDQLNGCKFAPADLSNVVARIKRLLQTLEDKSRIYYEHQYTFSFSLYSRNEDPNSASWEELEAALLKHLQSRREGHRSLDDFEAFNSDECKAEKDQAMPC